MYATDDPRGSGIWQALIVYEQRLVREGLRCLLDRVPQLRVVGSVKDGWAAVDFSRDKRLDLVIMPVSISGLNAIETVKHLVEGDPGIRIVGLARAGEERLAGQLMRNGAHGYGLLEDGPDELMAIVGNVLGFDASARPLDSGPGNGAPGIKLTSREIQVLTLIAEGRSVRDIAGELTLRPKTIDTHRRTIMDKLGIFSIAGLTKYAIRQRMTSV